VSHHTEWPKRFGKHLEIDGNPREIGEPSERALKRIEKQECLSQDLPPFRDTKRKSGNATPFTLSAPPVGERVGVRGKRLELPERHVDAERLPLTPALSPEQAQGRGSGYAELHCLSNFSFQRGASHAEELFDRAEKLGYAALAITDECSLSGIVRALDAAKGLKVKLIVGTEVRLADGIKLVILATTQYGYSDICKLITTGRRCSEKGEYRLTREDVEQLGGDVRILWSPGSLANADAAVVDNAAKWIKQHFSGRAWIAVELHRGPDDEAELQRLRDLGQTHDLRLVAAGDVHMHIRARRALHDVLTAIRLGKTVAEAGDALFPNGERHLRTKKLLAKIYPADLLEETVRIAEQVEFDLGNLKYTYPHELVPQGLTAIAHLRDLTEKGMRRFWPREIPTKVREQVEKELALIEELKFEHFFLTVEDIVRWARKQLILCQGRGSSANSAVCYCLGITAISPETGNLLFERFLSRERNEPPDIDVDFEHERREEVIQYVFNKYGRHRAALAATVISYRGKSATRDVGRALGLPDDALDQLTSMFSRVSSNASFDHELRDRGFDPDSLVMKQLKALVRRLIKFPRHLSQHVGGFVISDQPLHHLVPIENAAMPERTIIQWDKDDLESMTLLKVDCLALGMLTCIRKCFDLLKQRDVADLMLHTVPQDDVPTYDMICQADTMGVFQIESRAQMSMLPRLRPRTLYDLTIEVAIVRPGPIQGHMVHPYLRRRKGLEAIDYPQSESERKAGDGSSQVKDVLSRTLGVPIFQEQVMKLIQVTAGFTPGDADELRRAMAAWKRKGGLEKFYDRIRDGMLSRGYEESYFERIFEQIKGFGDYGFPESHAASFGLLSYVSSWLKCHHPAAFTCALLNSQPMGFYQPSQLIQDAQKHGVVVRPVDATISTWDCALEPTAINDKPELRLGLRLLKGMSKDLAQRLVDARNERPIADVADMTRRAHVTAKERACLADAGALRSLSEHRHRARWESAGAELPLPILANSSIDEQSIMIRPPSLREDVMNDYARLGLSLTMHPLALIRPELKRRRVIAARATSDTKNNGRRMRCAGLVTVRQHPGTAKGVIFVTLEDETGQVNVVVWKTLAQEQHRVLLESSVMAVDGTLQASDGVFHLIAERLHDYSGLLPKIRFESRDFH
jgi:error-prone DNA polymerase